MGATRAEGTSPSMCVPFKLSVFSTRCCDPILICLALSFWSSQVRFQALPACVHVSCSHIPNSNELVHIHFFSMMHRFPTPFLEVVAILSRFYSAGSTRDTRNNFPRPSLDPRNSLSAPTFTISQLLLPLLSLVILQQ